MAPLQKKPTAQDYSNILGMVKQPPKTIPSIPKQTGVTTGPGITTPTKINVNLLKAAKTQAETKTTPTFTPEKVEASKFGTQVSASEEDFVPQLQYDIQNGATADEVLQAYPELKGNTQLINELTYDITNGATLEEITRAYPELYGMGQEQPKGVDTGIGGVVEGAISQVPAFVSNVASFVPQTLSKGAGFIGEKLGVEKEKNPFYTSGMGDAERLKQFGEASKQAIKKFGIEVDDTTAQKIGEELTNIAGSTLLPGGAGVTKLKGAGVLGTAGRGAVLGAKMTPGYIAGSEGRLPTVGEEIAGTVGGAILTPAVEKLAIPAVTGLAQKSKKYGTALLKGGTEGLGKSVKRDITKLKEGTVNPLSGTVTRNIPEAIVRRDLGFTPTERRNIEKILGKTESQYILEKGLAGKGKEELAEVFSKQANDMYKGIGEKLKNVKADPIKSSFADEALQDMLDQLTSKPKVARAYSKDIIAIENMLKKGEYSLDELNNIRRAFDKVNTGMYTAKGEVRSGVETGIDTEIRNGIKNQLEKEAKKYGIDVKQMNQELRAGIELKDALLRRLSQEERNNFIGLQDLGVSAILSGGEPVTALATIGAKKYAESVAPTIAQKLYNLNKTANVSSRLTRGNPITALPKSSKLGLTNNTVNNMVQPPKVTPKTEQVTPKKPNKINNKVLKPKK